jgi:hypothetical protein
MKPPEKPRQPETMDFLHQNSWYGCKCTCINFTGAFAPVDALIAPLYQLHAFDIDLPIHAVRDHLFKLISGMDASRRFHINVFPNQDPCALPLHIATVRFHLGFQAFELFAMHCADAIVDDNPIQARHIIRGNSCYCHTIRSGVGYASPKPLAR